MREVNEARTPRPIIQSLLLHPRGCKNTKPNQIAMDTDKGDM